MSEPTNNANADAGAQAQPTAGGDGAQQAQAVAPVIDYDELSKRIDLDGALERAMNRAGASPSNEETPEMIELAPPGFRISASAGGWEGAAADRPARPGGPARVGAQRDVDGRTGACYQLARMINAMKSRNVDSRKLEDAYGLLIKAGHYDHQLAERVDAHAGTPMIDTRLRTASPDEYASKAISVLRAPFTAAGGSTVQFGDGGVFVPDVIFSDIAMQEDVYGLVQQKAQRVPLVWGVQNYPKLTSKARFAHVGEGAEFTASKNAFGSIAMTPRKAGVILPWTRELNDTAGAAIMPMVTRLLAENRSKLLDDDAVNGDGTSTYGGIVGLMNHSDVVTKTLATGKTGFANADWKDWIDLRFTSGIDEGSVRGSCYAIHPLAEQYLLGLSVAQFTGQSPGAPVIYNAGNNLGFVPSNDGRGGRFGGREVIFTESMTAPSADAVSTNFALYGNFSNLYYGELNGIQIETMTEGSIPDPDGGSDIKLGAQDYIALKIRIFVEVKVLFGNAFAKMQTAAS